MRTYEASAVEQECQQAWKLEDRFAVGLAERNRAASYIYACTPFTTGTAHMGHVRSYTLADVQARWLRSRGRDVLWAMGFDAFGLPNEIAAIQRGIPPQRWVGRCADQMKEQFDRLGLSVDWSRCFITSDPSYYRWTQWVFLRFWERGLIYRSEGTEQWCPNCRTVLAVLQVSADGRCWRCDAHTELARIPQWYLRILPYADELDGGIDELTGWDESVRAFQRSLLGRTDGVEVRASLPDGSTVVAFTPHPHEIARAAFLAISPEHVLADALAGPVHHGALQAFRRRSLSRDDRRRDRVPSLRTDAVATVPGLAQQLPVIITPAVDTRFGGGAALGIPDLDPTDATIAAQWAISSPASPGSRELVPCEPCRRYRIRDISISRQRSWGTPIPMILCDDCGEVPVPDEELPVRLPPDLMPTGHGSALSSHPEFVSSTCPRCSRPARRETDTLDVHFDSIWMLVPFCVPGEARAESVFTHPDLERWLPVDQVVCGVDQAGWWVNDRLFFKVMCDQGYFPWLSSREPVRRILMHEMVLSGRRKMSKSHGNSVDPDALISEYGADAVRLAVLHINPRKSFDWSEDALKAAQQFLNDVWAFAARIGVSATLEELSELTEDPRRRRALRWIQTAHRKLGGAYDTQAYHLALKELRTLLVMLRRFETEAGRLCDLDRAVLRLGLGELVDHLEPMAPHLAYAVRHGWPGASDVPTVAVAASSR